MWKKLSVLILLIALFLSFANRSGEEDREGAGSGSLSSSSTLTASTEPGLLLYDYYGDSCPQAEEIVRSTVTNLYKIEPNVAPALLRLVFHDCFIQGCDGSVLLNSTNGFMSEKEAKPNLSLKGFDVIDTIKHKIEDECPATVSCSDILVLAARDAVALVGGPYYILKTGRRDSLTSNFFEAHNQLPTPDDDLSKIESLFADRGFDQRETVALFGGHNIGTIHCQFLTERLTNFSGTGRPDPSIEPSFLNVMMSKCIDPQDGLEEPGLDMSLQAEAGPEFGAHYYNSLLQGKGILRADQQLMASEGTASWVQAYQSDRCLFQRDFAYVMMKLSNFKVLAEPAGQIRHHCAFVA